MKYYTRLFEPGKIGELELKNRIVLAPMVTDYQNPDGFISERLINYYAERAIGGAGLIIIESSRVHIPQMPHRLSLTSDKYIPGFRRLVNAIHKNGAKVICQVNPHGGRAEKTDPASASIIPHPFTGVMPRQLSTDDIKKIELEFQEGVRRVKEAGFDGVMVHGATGYLVAEFLSPRTNKRTDEYGGNVQKRARFALELVEIASKIGGTDYPVTFRLMADERLDDGFVLKDAIVVCKMLQEAGVVAIHITAGAQETPEYSCPPTYMPPGCNSDLSQAIKKELKIPVAVAGKINDPDIAEAILRDGKADFVDLGRALLADPHFANKAKEGKQSEIRRCISCQRCSVGTIQEQIPLHCTVNPSLGREKEFELLLSKPAPNKKKVLVIGGGPGGMESAIVAAQRGHNVTLWEKDKKLGGQLNVAIVPPGKSDLNKLLIYLKMLLEKHKVKVRLQTEATIESVLEFSPDAVVVAAGSSTYIPDIPGIHGKNVIDSRRILSGEAQPGDRVIIMGGSQIGCETADFLAEKCQEITLVFRKQSPLEGELVDWSIKKVLLERLTQRKVRIIAGIKEYQEITSEGIKLIDKGGTEVILKADSIILATGSSPDNLLAKSLIGKVGELYEVGDCVDARQLLEAIQEGADIALNI